jgi:hypothetical protein
MDQDKKPSHATVPLSVAVSGLPASTAGECVTLFDHINAGAPYSAIYVCVHFLEIEDFMRRRAGILEIAVQTIK